MIKKYQRVQRLLLCVGGHFFAHRQMGQIKFHLQSADLPRVFFIVIENVATNPAHIRSFGPDRIVIHPQHIPDMIEQLARPRHWPGKAALSSLAKLSIFTGTESSEKCLLLFCICNRY